MNLASECLRVSSYTFLKTIGKGNFAIVKLATHIITNQQVAIKIITKSSLNADNLRRIRREIQVLKLLNHSNITRLYEVMESDQLLFIVMEYASRGDMFEYIEKNGRMCEADARTWFIQMISALGYCHDNGVVHRDLKVENILIDGDNNLKIADFGFSTFYTQSQELLNTACGSPPYAAPELFEGKPYDGRLADIWSMGVLLYILVCGGFPFSGNTVLELRASIISGVFPVPHFISTDCECLLRNMMMVSTEQRYSLEQIRQSSWLSDAPGTSSSVHPAVSTQPAAPTASSHFGKQKEIVKAIVCKVAHIFNVPEAIVYQSLQSELYDGIYACYNFLLKGHSNIDNYLSSSLPQLYVSSPLNNTQPVCRDEKMLIERDSDVRGMSELVKRRHTVGSDPRHSMITPVYSNYPHFHLVQLNTSIAQQQNTCGSLVPEMGFPLRPLGTQQMYGHAANVCTAASPLVSRLVSQFGVRAPLHARVGERHMSTPFYPPSPPAHLVPRRRVSDTVVSHRVPSSAVEHHAQKLQSVPLSNNFTSSKRRLSLIYEESIQNDSSISGACSVFEPSIQPLASDRSRTDRVRRTGLTSVKLCPLLENISLDAHQSQLAHRGSIPQSVVTQATVSTSFTSSVNDDEL